MSQNFNIENSKINRKSLNKSISLYFEEIYPSIDLKQNYNKFKEEFTNVFRNNKTRIAFPACILNEDGSIADTISPEFVNLKSNAGNGGETVTKYLLHKMYNITNVIYEPNGEGTHPDFLVKLNNKNILIEIKTIYCNEFNKDGSLKIKVNNATNSEGAVRKYLNEYKKYIYNNKFNYDEFIKNNDIETEERQFFETFVIFYYYEIDNKLNCINYFDFEIIPLPVVISFMLTDDGYLIYDNNNNVKLTLKSAGETSQNNNVNLTLYLKQIFNEENNVLIDPLMLYLLGHTYKNNDHLISNNELNKNNAIEKINNLHIDVDIMLNTNNQVLLIRTMNKISSDYKYVSKYKNLIDINFEQYRSDYNDIKKLYNKKLCSFEFLKLNNILLEINDINNFKPVFNEYKKYYKKLNKIYNMSNYDNLYNSQFNKYKQLKTKKRLTY